MEVVEVGGRAFEMRRVRFVVLELVVSLAWGRQAAG